MRVLTVLAVCVVLAGCTDSDWQNAMSYVPMEKGTRTAQNDEAPPARQAETASLPTPVAAPTAAASVSQPAPPAAAIPPQQTVPAMMSPPPAETMPATSEPEQKPMLADAAPRIDEHCRVVATQRATDGGYMGMDEDQQKVEYDGTYAACAAWDAAHGMAR
ncbi:MAG TPA: hypothetical protein VIJ85_03105 [Rhizomicrobium sp.]